MQSMQAQQQRSGGVKEATLVRPNPLDKLRRPHPDQERIDRIAAELLRITQAEKLKADDKLKVAAKRDQETKPDR